MGEKRDAYGGGPLKERGHLEDLGIDGRIFKWINGGVL